MAVMLKPENKNAFETNTSNPAMMDVKPGVVGINPVMLAITMIIGAGMWGGIGYVVHMLIQLFTG